ncbi:hypothetical protein BS47DRAFT_1488988 [Hydnum rufescens UP504]|uniref:NAD(P)-binding protein n=1 Tax=Hydnum rufescens UP504 TaxID=1448309 RepID=A0A9P6AK03_9AGAM|nr:hypothetical protein BS47DRAFT_1488988 [Hydnum rufescens UP504]
MSETVITSAATSTGAPQPPRGIMSKFRLDGKIVAVTGGARGLGYEMLRAFCEAGAAGAAIIDVLQEYGEEAIKEIHAEFGIPASFYRVDVRDHVAVEEAINGIVRDFGGIDVLLCSAGVADNLPAESYPADRFKRVIDINLNGVFFACQAAGNHMIASGKGGSIINIASMSGHIVNYPQPQSAYNASKAAVIHLSKSLAAEWAPHKVRVNTISPGYMNTVLNEKFDPLLKKAWRTRVSHANLDDKMGLILQLNTASFSHTCHLYERTPVGRMGHVNELSGAALYLACEASAFCTGTDIIIDGDATRFGTPPLSSLARLSSSAPRCPRARVSPPASSPASSSSSLSPPPRTPRLL